MGNPLISSNKVSFSPVKTLIDAVDSSTTYLGMAELGSSISDEVWRILKISTSGNVTTIAYADGDDKFNNVWNDRTGYTYT